MTLELSMSVLAHSGAGGQLGPVIDDPTHRQEVVSFPVHTLAVDVVELNFEDLRVA